jgi:hypothetical protein
MVLILAGTIYVSVAHNARSSGHNQIDKQHVASVILRAVNPLAFLKTRLFATLVAGMLAADLFLITGCVYPVVPPPGGPGPSVDIGVYGSPAGYYYRNYPVYIYRGRPAYYYGGRRYFYRPGPHYYYRRGYRYYY